MMTTFKRYILRSALVLAIEIAALVLVMVLNPPRAHADIGNGVTQPCDYPGVGGSGLAGALVPAYWYWCDFPIEENGSNWHCQYLGAEGTGQIGFQFYVTASISGPVGGIIGSCYWRCPDNTPMGQLAAQPNPPGAWKYALRPAKCKPIGQSPLTPTPQLVPDVASPVPEGPPPEAVAPPNFEVGPPPPSGITPAVTNPDLGNPDATQNPQR
jgi:hypothetical protein